MIYIRSLTLPSEIAENRVITEETGTCYNSFYPFGLFPQKQLRRIELDTVTMLYGGNGSGKSTLLNVLAEKTNAARYSDFNASPFFSDYVEMCYAEYGKRPKRSFVLSSDDVFDYALSARAVNERIEDRRNELFDKYVETFCEAETNPDVLMLHGLDDYERWREVHEILSPKHSQSEYVKKRTGVDISLYSNGETAKRFFIDKIEGGALYFLDEPENSLSVEYQIELCEYIYATVRSSDSQFVIATHSPVFLAMRGARIYDLDSRPVRLAKWTELPNVRRYFDFFMERRSEFE